MSEVLSQPVVHALARALGHFVWQGAAIGLVTLVAFRLLRSSANARYLVGVTGLAAMLIAPIVTLVLLNEAESGTAVAASINPGTTAATVGFAEQVSTAAIAAVKRPVEIDWLAVAVVAWMIGAMGFALRLAGGWIVARRYVTRAVEPASEHLVDLVHDLSTRMGIPRAIAIVQSSAVSVPVLIGWLKPTIVLPIAALASLTPSQVEALIAHELAHVRRHDYLVNLLQSIVEALLFYHPAVWWLSRQVRAERELCCDDLAVGVCDRLVYATALTDLAAMAPTGVALAATDGDLLARVRRILGRETSAGRPGATPLIAIALVAAVVVPAALAAGTQTQHPVTGSHVAIDPKTHDALHQQATPTPSPVAQSQTDKEKELLKKHAELSKKLAEQNQDVQKKHLEAVRKSVDDMQHIEAMQKAELHEMAAKTIEHARTMDQAKAAQEAQAKDLAAEVERMKELFQRGLVSQAQFQAAKDQLAEAQAKNSQVAHDLQTKDLLAQVERTKQLYERGLASQAQLQAAEARLEEAKHAQGNEEMAALRAKLQQAEIELQRAKTLFDKGLMTATKVAELEQAVADLKKKIGGSDEAQLHLALAAERLKAMAEANRASARDLQLALQAREVAPEKSQQTQPAQQTQTFYLKKASVSEVAQILNQMLSGGPGPRPTITTDSATKSLTVTGSDAMLALVKNIVASADGVKPDPAEQEMAAQLAPKTRIQYLDATTPLKVGEVVNLTIGGEPGLARLYTVGDDGMIQVPFMGSIKVTGLNTNQIREAVGKWMVEHKLGSVDQVTVRAYRAIK